MSQQDEDCGCPGAKGQDVHRGKEPLTAIRVLQAIDLGHVEDLVVTDETWPAIREVVLAQRLIWSHMPHRVARVTRIDEVVALLDARHPTVG